MWSVGVGGWVGWPAAGTFEPSSSEGEQEVLCSD